MLIETTYAPLKEKTTNAATPVAPNLKPQPDSGIISGSLVETQTGWRPVELLRAGDLVQTFDGGLRQVQGVERAYYGAAHGGFSIDGVIFIPGGALGNCEALFVMPEQHLMIQSDLAAELLGTPTVLLPASALVGFYGIDWKQPAGVIEAITLGFEQEEVVYANSGVLLHCPTRTGSDFFTSLDHWRAKALLSLMQRDAGLLDEAIGIIARDEPHILAA